MKDPVSVFGGWRGFFVSRLAGPARKISAPDRAKEPIAAPGICSRRDATMPPWLEVLLNVIAFAGFIGIAKYHKPRDEKLPDR